MELVSMMLWILVIAFVIIGMVVWLSASKTKKKDSRRTAGKFLVGMAVLVLALGFMTSTLTIQDLEGLGDTLTSKGVATGEAISVAGTTNLCGDTPTASVKVKVFDELADQKTMATFNNGYLYDVDKKRIEANTSIAAAETTLSSAASCGYGRYQIKIPTEPGKYSSTESEVFTIVEKKGASFDLKTQRSGLVEVKLVDAGLDQEFFNFPDNQSATNASTSFVRLNKTEAYNTAARANKAFAAGDTLDLDLQIRTEDQDEIYGDYGKPLWLIVNTQTDNEIAEPTVSFKGRTISEAKSAIDSDSQDGSKVNTAEFAYKIGKAGDISRAIEHIYISLEPKSGQEPDANDQIELCVLPEGIYESSEEANTLKQGIYTDATTPALAAVNSTSTPCIRVNIS